MDVLVMVTVSQSAEIPALQARESSCNPRKGGQGVLKPPSSPQASPSRSEDTAAGLGCAGWRSLGISGF